MSEHSYIQGVVIMAIAMLFLMPVAVTIFYPKEMGVEETPDTLVSEDVINDLFQDYYNFTNSTSTYETVWCLTGIYTPYLGGNYKYTPDRWLYGEKVNTYTPSQYTDSVGSSSVYTVELANDDSSVYRYVVGAGQSTQDGHVNGDLYTDVTMDVSQQSNIFFTESLKKDQSNIKSGYFTYEYTGYRYAFQPLSDGWTVSEDENGDKTAIKVAASTTSLSLIWYNFLDNSGISGQLVLSGSDSGVDYITAAEIVSAFNSTNNIAKFNMIFNGCKMNIYIKINPYYTTNGWSVEDCYNAGYWSIMVTSVSTDPSMFTSSDYALNLDSIWETLVDLFTFNMDSYPMSSTMQIVASLTLSLLMYSALLALAVHEPKLLIIAGIVILIQSITAFFQGGIDLDISSWWPW